MYSWEIRDRLLADGVCNAINVPSVSSINRYAAARAFFNLIIEQLTIIHLHPHFRIIRTKLGQKFKERAPKVADSQIKQLLREHLQKKREVDDDTDMKPEVLQQRECVCVCVWVCIYEWGGEGRCCAEESDNDRACISVSRCSNAVRGAEQRVRPAVCGHSGFVPVVPTG